MKTKLFRRRTSDQSGVDTRWIHCLRSGHIHVANVDAGVPVTAVAVYSCLAVEVFLLGGAWIHSISDINGGLSIALIDIRLIAITAEGHAVEFGHGQIVTGSTLILGDSQVNPVVRGLGGVGGVHVHVSVWSHASVWSQTVAESVSELANIRLNMKTIGIQQVSSDVMEAPILWDRIRHRDVVSSHICHIALFDGCIDIRSARVGELSLNSIDGAERDEEN